MVYEELIAGHVSRRVDEELSLLAEQAIVRTGGAPLIGGNAVRILRDSTENYPAWLGAIAAARRCILFENYIVGCDKVGRQFVDALAGKAREGVPVYLVYDWLGTLLPGDLFKPLIDAGGHVRCFNPPRLDSPFGWLTRDHRKVLSVDGEVAFVSGLCEHVVVLVNGRVLTQGAPEVVTKDPHVLEAFLGSDH